jgi:ParB/RepB/Spo0J family partition protein
VNSVAPINSYPSNPNTNEAPYVPGLFGETSSRRNATAEDVTVWIALCREALRKRHVSVEERDRILRANTKHPWRHIHDADGKPFMELEDLCKAPEPYGFGSTLARLNTILRQARTGPVAGPSKAPKANLTGGSTAGEAASKVVARVEKKAASRSSEPATTTAATEAALPVVRVAEGGVAATAANETAGAPEAAQIIEEAPSPPATKDSSRATHAADPPVTISVGLLDNHPRNPRLGLREDIVAGLVAQMRAAGVYDRSHAITVRVKADGRYEILAGHHRVEAAKRAGLADVWAFVVEATDDEAYMRLVTANTQERMTALEIALHALGVVNENSDESVKSHAAKVGLHGPNLSRYMKGARVFLVVRNHVGPDNVIRLREKAEHLARLANVPEALQILLVQTFVAAEASGARWSLKGTEAAVEKALASLDTRGNAPANPASPAIDGGTAAVGCAADEHDRADILNRLTQIATAIGELQTFLHGMPVGALMKRVSAFVEHASTGGATGPDVADLVARRALYGRIEKLRTATTPEVAKALGYEAAIKTPNLKAADVDRLEARATVQKRIEKLRTDAMADRESAGIGTKAVDFEAALRNPKLTAADVERFEKAIVDAVGRARAKTPIEAVLAAPKAWVAS